MKTTLFIKAFWHDTRGATALEYALIIGLFFMAIVGAITTFTDSMGTMFQKITTAISNSG